MWELKALNELGYVSRGKSKHRPRNAPHLYGDKYPFIQTADVKHSNLYITEVSQYYSDAGLAQSKMWSKGTLCITIAANIADTAILGIDACFPDSIIGFIGDNKKCDTKFIKYQFNLMQKHFQLFSQGATQDNLSQEKLLSLNFRVPPLPIQKKIASILSAYDDLIENNLRRIELLEKAARELYKEWFVRFKFPGHEKVKFKDGLPEGWERKTAFDVMEILSGGTPSTKVENYWNGDIPFYTPKDASHTFYINKTLKNLTDFGLKKCNSRLYEKYTIFITARGTVGNLNLNIVPMAMNQSCYALIGRKPLNQFFLYLSLFVNIQEYKQKSGGAVFNAIIVDTFKYIPYILPASSVIQNFNKIITPIFNQVEALYLENQLLNQARDLLLPRLIKGEIEV